MEEKIEYNSPGPGYERDSGKKQSRIPVWVLAFLLASLVLAGISMVRFPKVLSEYKVYRQAELRMNEGETMAALQELLAVVERHPRSVPMITKLIDISMEAGYYDLAAYVFDTYLAGLEVSDSQYARMMGYTRRLDAYYASYEVMEAMLQEPEEGLSPKETEERSRQMVEDLKQRLDEPEMDAAFLYYYMGAFSTDDRERYEYLKQCYEKDRELFDVRVQLANASRRLGNLEEAKGYLEEALRKEKEDVGALRGMAVLSLLEGDAQRGLELSQRAYELDADALYVRDTYLVALHVNGMQEREAEIIEEMGNELEEDTRKLLLGECSLSDYYMGEE